MPNDDQAEPDARLFLLVHQFRATMDALLELQEAVGPHAMRLHESRIDTKHLAALAGLSELDQNKIAAAFESLSERMEAKLASGEPETTATETDLQVRAESETIVDVDQPEGAVSAKTQSVIQEVFGANPLALADFAIASLRAAVSSPHVILNGSLLTVAIATFEALLAGLITEHYRWFPTAMDTSEKEFSFADLLKYDTLAEAREAAISNRVDHLMRKGLTDWSNWLDRTLKVSLSQSPEEQREINELFQRRHIIVHNAGRVSRLYLANTDFGDAEPPKLDNPLPVSDEYLSRAIDLLDQIGSIISLTAWIKWTAGKSGSSSARRTLMQFAYAYVQSERWTVASTFCMRMEPLADRDASRLVLQVNRWLAKKRLHGLSAIVDEVNDWDTSAASANFQLAKGALLDKFDQATGLVSRALAAETVTARELREWPLLLEFRDKPGIMSIIDEYDSDLHTDEETADPPGHLPTTDPPPTEPTC